MSISQWLPLEESAMNTRTSPDKHIEYCRSHNRQAATSFLTVKCRCRNSWLFGAATLPGRAKLKSQNDPSRSTEPSTEVLSNLETRVLQFSLFGTCGVSPVC